MTPAAIYTAVRDALIGGALIYVIWFIHNADQNAVKVKDLTAVQQQLTQNAKEVAAWQEQANEAEAQRREDMATVTAAIAQQRSPIILRQPSNPGPVSGNSTAPASSATCAGGNAAEAGTDIRPAINQYEVAVETYLGQCRSVLASWPK